MTVEFQYDVALSFAGEDRATAEQLAIELRSRGVRVFYDEFERANLWGKNLYEYLTDVYTRKSRYCIILVSRNYSLKAWTGLERRSAQARDLGSSAEYILPVKLDDTELLGLLDTVAFEDLRNQSPRSIVELLCQKLGKCNTGGTDLRQGNSSTFLMELCSRHEFSRRDLKLFDVNAAIVKFAGRASARIIGLQSNPHRVQIEATV